jgi:hypothetical protein
LPRSAPPTTCILLWLDKLGLFYIHPSLFFFCFLFSPGLSLTLHTLSSQLCSGVFLFLF